MGREAGRIAWGPVAGAARTFALVLLALAVVSACGKKNEEPATAAAPPAASPEPAAPPAAAPAAAPSAAPSSIEDTGFALRLTEAGPYKAGELGRVVLNLEPRGNFHINQEYPVEISITSDSETTLPKAKLEKPDAAEFGEKKARFEVPFTPKVAGEHKLMANVKFAVCTEENCVPDERDLALALAVK